MSGYIYLRPLKFEDAETSYHWRNDVDIWKYTGHQPDIVVTLEIEQQWIAKVLMRKDEKRFAICTLLENKYIGNVQLTNINDSSGEFHIFIGDKNYWGRGIGKEATLKMINMAFNKFHLNEVFLEVDVNNIPAVKAYQAIGFNEYGKNDSKLKMKIINNGL